MGERFVTHSNDTCEIHHTFPQKERSLIEPRPRRPVRSFVRREGRMTTAQTRALEDLSSVYGVPESPEMFDVGALFSTCRPITLEIGFGDGQHLQQLAADHPEQGFIGIEAYRPGIGRLLHGIADEELNNLRVLIGDAEDIVPRRFPRCSLQHILVLFPDPWPKKRHHKRRLLSMEFLKKLSMTLTTDGQMSIATDCAGYATDIELSIEKTGNLQLLETNGSKTAWSRSTVTKYERRAQRLGHITHEIRAIRC